MHGRYDGTIEYDENSITVDGKKVLFFAEMDPKRTFRGARLALTTL